MDWLLNQFEHLIAFVGDDTRQGALTIIGGSIAAFCLAGWAIFRHLREKSPEQSAEQISSLKVSLEDYHKHLSTQLAELTSEIGRSTDGEKYHLLQRKEELERRLSDIEASYAEASKKADELEVALLKATENISTSRIDSALTDIHQGKLDEAAEVLGSVVSDLQPYLERAAVAAYGLGLIAEERADWEQAAKQYTISLGYYEGESNLHKAMMYLMRSGNFSTAVTVGEKLVDFSTKKYGRINSNTAGHINNLAASVYECGKADEAISLLQESLDIKRALGEHADGDYAASITNLANMHVIQGKFAIAEKLQRDALAIVLEMDPPNRSYKATMTNGLAECLRLNKKFEESEKLFRENIEECIDEFGKDSAEYARCLNFLAKVFIETDRTQEAIDLWKESFSLSQKHNGLYHPYSIAIADNLLHAIKDRENTEDVETASQIKQLYSNLENK